VPLTGDTAVGTFEVWALVAEPKLRHALTASFGVQVGREAAADALSYAWEHWEAVREKDNPVGYVYGVGRNKAWRRLRRRRVEFPDVPEQRLPHVEPGLPAAVGRLTERQRVVVTLLYGYDWTMAEVADVLGIEKTTVQNHSERGLALLRKALGVT